MSNNATVEDIADMMLDLMAQGKCDHVVYCNDEYILAKKGDSPDINDEDQTVSIGGYTS